MVAHAATHDDAHAGTSSTADIGEHRALVEQIDQRVRELVRAEGVDPQHEPGAVRRLAEEVVRAHDERSLTGQVARVAEPARVVAEVVARVSGFGALQPYLDDDEVEEIWINKPSLVHKR